MQLVPPVHAIPHPPQSLGSVAVSTQAAPQVLWPRVVLSHVLLQEGQDGPAAERALRDVLALDPDHTETRDNLALLLRQPGKQAGNRAS